MNTNIENNEEVNLRKQFITKYLGQRDKLPGDAKKYAEEQDPKGKIELYAMADLTDDLMFGETWLILSTNRLTIVEKTGDRYVLEGSFPTGNISKIKELPSLSCTTFLFLTADDLPPLAKVRFTLRQKIIMGHVKYLLEGKIKEKETHLLKDLNPDEEYAKAILQPVLDAQNSVSNQDSKALLRLLKYLLPYKKSLAFGMGGAIATTLVSLVPAYLSGYLIDQIIRPFQDGNLELVEATKIGWLLIGTLGAIYLMREFFIWVRLNKMSILGEKVARDLRTELYDHLQKLSMDFYSKKQTGSIITRVSSDTDRIWDFIAFGVVEVSISIITLVSLSSVLIYMDWRLGLMMTIPVPLLLFGIYWHGERMKHLFIKAWRKWSSLTEVLSDTIPGIQVVKAFNQEEREKSRFNKRNDTVTEEFERIHEAWTRFWPILMVGIHMTVMGVWVMALPRLLNSESSVTHLTAGTFVSFLLYMTMFAQPIEIIGQVARMLNRALSSAYRIFEILDTKPTIREVKEPIVLNDLKGDIEFKNVYFSYDGVRHILNDLSFNVKAGEMIGLVGGSGGGKSTITKLIARFYDVDSGNILIDGKNLKDLDVGKFRQQVGMVLQDPYLFHGTVWENISYGIPNVSRKEIIEAAKVANAHNFIGKFTHGYDTVVGERGHTLSGGERQRISIARAILTNPRILILDEATSAVDTETERKIQEALDRLIEGRTVFAVAHRLSTLRQADRIFVIGKGNIIEQGTHADLLADKDGEYRKLHKMQQEMSEFFAL